MMQKEILEVISEQERFTNKQREEDIRRLCDNGISQSQARKIWICSVMKELQTMEEYWSIKPFFQRLEKV